MNHSWEARQRFRLQRGKNGMNKGKKIEQNRAMCNACGQIVESTERHEFVTCRCGGLSVDGGTAYLRRVFGNQGYTELSYQKESVQ